MDSGVRMEMNMKRFTMRVVFLCIVVALSTAGPARATNDGDGERWQVAHATYYGGSDAQGTNGGACGYQNVFSMGYGTMTTAISSPLYGEGNTCGACFEVRCNGDDACYYQNSIVVTATNQSPQWSTAYPGPHFDLSQPAFNQIADVVAGHVPIEYRRVNCQKDGGILFAISGHTYFMQVLVYNVGGRGDVSALYVKGDRSDWVQMTRLWGQYWSTQTILDGQALCFCVTISDGSSLTSYNVAPSNWQYGQTFEGIQF